MNNRNSNVELRVTDFVVRRGQLDDGIFEATLEMVVTLAYVVVPQVYVRSRYGYPILDVLRHSSSMRNAAL